MENKKIIAVIPARGGSKGILRKNIKNLAGKPLIAWTIIAALGSKYLDKVIVSTEDKEITEISKEWGAEVIKRPEELARDESKMIELIPPLLNVLKERNYIPDVIVLLQPTSPLRFAHHIDESIETFLEGEYDSLISVCPSHVFIWRTERDRATPVNYDFKKRQRRQDRRPEYRENGAIYILERESLVKEKTIPCGRIGLYIMPEENSFEIDKEFDLWRCEVIIKKYFSKLI